MWHETLPHLPKTSRHTIGFKIDGLFLETTEFILMAASASGPDKLKHLRSASGKLDLLKFFLRTAWEIKALSDKKFLLLSECLVEVGKMLGGWMKRLQTQ